MKEEPTIFQLAQLAALTNPPHTDPKRAVKRAMEFWQASIQELAQHDHRPEYLAGLFRTDNGKSIPIFTDTPEEWEARIAGYPGNPGDVTSAIWDKKIPTEEVEKQLFRDKTLTRTARHGLLVGLIRFGVFHGIQGTVADPHGHLPDYISTSLMDTVPGFPIHPKNIETAEREHARTRRPSWMPNMHVVASEVYFVRRMEALLEQPTLSGNVIRWLVEARQKQLALAKSRVIPESIRNPQEDDSGDDNSIQFKRKITQ